MASGVAMTARIASIAVGYLVAGTLTFAPQADAKPAKGAHAAGHAKASPKADMSVNTHSAALPGAETGIPEPQRLAIQADLVWLNNYGEMAAEEINAHLVDQIKAFQRRNNGKDTGVLTDQERAALADAAKPRQAAAGWRLIDDTATGARLGLPEKLVPKASAARTGSRWTSKGGQVRIETFRLREASLPALFDQDKRVSQREIGSSNLKPNSFVITGEQGLKKFVVRVQSSGSEVRGVTILYDQATEGTMAPIAIAVADTFDGFPIRRRCRRPAENAASNTAAPWSSAVPAISSPPRKSPRSATPLRFRASVTPSVSRPTRPTILRCCGSTARATLCRCTRRQRRRRRRADALRHCRSAGRGQRQSGDARRCAAYRPRSRSGAEARLFRRRGHRCAGPFRRPCGTESAHRSPDRPRCRRRRWYPPRPCGLFCRRRRSPLRPVTRQATNLSFA